MAQDFAATFGLGSSTRQISAVDANGVCMAGIQALHRKLNALESEIEVLRRQVEEPTSPRNPCAVNNNDPQSLGEFGQRRHDRA